VIWSFLKGELKWSSAEIAYEMWVNERRLIEWVNSRNVAMANIANGQTKKVEQYIKDLKAKHIKAEPKKRELDLNVQKVVKLFYLEQDENLADTANALKVDFSDFKAWWQRKLGIINQELRKIRQG
jgi:hypothetical protein